MDTMEEKRLWSDDETSRSSPPSSPLPTLTKATAHRPPLLSRPSRLLSDSPTPCPSPTLSTAPPLRVTDEWWATPIPSTALRHIRLSGLFLLRSIYRTHIAFDPALGRYAVTSFSPASPLSGELFPSLFNCAIVESNGFLYFYLRDVLHRHRLQIHGGQLIAWPDGEPLKERKPAKKRPPPPPTRPPRDDDETSTDSEAESRKPKPLSIPPVSAVDRREGLVFRCVVVGRVSAPIFLFDPVSLLLSVSAKKDATA